MDHCYAKMAASGPRDGGRGSAPPAPSKPPTEGGGNAANDGERDMEKLNVREEKLPPQLQEWSSTSKREASQPPHVKEEEEDLWITLEGECLLELNEADITKLPLTVVSVTTDDQEDKPSESSQWFRFADVQQLIGQEERPTQVQEGSPRRGALKEEDPPLSHIKEEEVELWTSQEGERLLRQETSDLASLPLTVKIEDKPPKSACRLTQHMLTRTGEKRFSCSVCAKGFPFKSSLTRHMLTHTGEKPFGCSICGKSFPLKDNLTRHMLTHTGEKAFSCSVCGQGFTRKSAMLLHVLTHTRRKPFYCSVCGRIFYRKEHMVSHIRAHMKKPFCCSVCDRIFSRKEQMVSHMRILTGEKPFCCSVCGKSYVQQITLANHIVKHTRGEKSFCCTGCFCEPELTTQTQTHTGQKPFSCTFCGQEFSLKAGVLCHMRTHKGEKPFSC